MSPNSSRPEPHLTVPQVSTDEQPQAKDNLSPKFDEFLSFLKDDAPDNARDDDNAAASSGDDVLDKGELKTPDPEATPEAVPHVPAVVDPDVGGGPPVATSAKKKNVTPNYDLLAYSNYIHRHAETKADFSTALNSNAGTGKRCYRLNLERPFDIHCEQSPLEYGDYMAPWTKEVQPPTVGPTEYCPPRHLGGEEAVWRELMRWSHGSGSTPDKETMGSAAGMEESGVASNYAAGIGGSGWRKLKPSEFRAVKQLGEHNPDGELAFQAYDLSHVVLNAAGLAAHAAAAGRDVPPVAGSVRTMFSVDSNTSEQERSNRKSPGETADATARLFRRSEVSVWEKATKEEEARALQAQQEAEEKRLEKERQKASGNRKGGLKLGKSFKKLARKMTSTASSKSLQKGPGPRKVNAAAAMRCSVQASQIDKARAMVDGYDNGEGGLIITPGDGQTAGKADEVAPKMPNISLFVVGEYDVLNDLVNNGAKRLADPMVSSDLDLLLQNEPCPTPDRWVRSTGWGKCNPSSNYARKPPEDFDWEKYDDKLWLQTDDPQKAEVLLDASNLYARRNYAKEVTSVKEEEEDTLSQSQRVRKSRRRSVGTAKAKAGAAAKQVPEEEDTLSQSQRVRRSRRQPKK